MRTWDSIKYLYYGIALKYRQYEDVDALVNESYLKTFNDFDEPKLPHKIHFAIRNYIKELKNIYQINYQKHEAIGISLDENFDIKDKTDILATYDNYELIEARDFILTRLKNLSKDDYDLLLLSLSFEQKEIAIMMGRTTQMINLRLHQIYEKMRYTKKEYYQIDHARRVKRAEYNKQRRSVA